ncbi:DsbA family protein [Alteromonas sp. C1M14]|uniref:DsbA family protein n=1 Tax=Alteromonas sp. C1M14 TaxID=2841567 RepID=UPI001C098556|nr:DsbA family protein [Alteromonas sp. C1M14]MBU2978530.1 DsbA family protein [Alteromonas sp. C1M14]
MKQSSQAILYHVHDPMCSWCWAFRPTWQKVKQQLPHNIEVRYLLGGLAPDSNEPMPNAMKTAISGYWKTIQQRVPGTPFNFDFWTQCEPRRSTYPACRAVIAARNQDHSKESAMIKGIQEAYYLHAKNPSDDAVLIDLAASLGLNSQRFASDLNSLSTQNALAAEIRLGQDIGAQGFPSLILKTATGYQYIMLDYNNPDAILTQLNSLS